MELGQLRVFVTVAELGSITHASGRLHLSQPALSAQLKKLESDLGVTLFHRAPRGMVLTHAGEQLLPQARVLLARSDSFVSQAAHLAGRTTGLIRLGLMDCGYDLALPRILAALTQQHAQVQVELHTATSGLNLRALHAHKLDAAFVEGTFDAAGLHRVRLGTSRVGVVGPKRWAERLAHASLEDLSEMPWVGRPEGCSYWATFDALWSEGAPKPTSYQVTDTARHACSLAAAGMGLALVDLEDSADYLRSGEVVLWPHEPFEVPVWWVALSHRMNEPLLQHLEQVIRSTLPGPLRYSHR